MTGTGCRSEINKIYDPIRQKYLLLTPEEDVRQKTIKFLMKRLGVPQDRISYYTEVKDGASISVFHALLLQNTYDPVLITIDIIDNADRTRTLSSVSFPMKLIE